MKKALVILFLLVASTQAQAQEYAGFVDQFKIEIILTLAVAVCILAVLVLLVSLYAIRVFLNISRPVTANAAPKVSLWQGLMKKLTRSVPIEREYEVMTDHEYDGIRELDNRLPPWWLYGFYFTIFFAVAYLLYFHVLPYGKSSPQEYEAEMTQAKEEVAVYLASLENNIDETNATVTLIPEELAEAKGLYTQYCVTCHGQAGGGGVGPNLTDAYWIHGGDVKSIFKTVKYGVPQNGMISWQSQLTPKQMQGMASFILAMQGTNPENAKEPQGDLFQQTLNATDSIRVN